MFRKQNFILFMCMITLCFCVNASFCAENFNTTPRVKPDGNKYHFAFVDYDEYMPSSRQFYYILSGLEELGWIEKGRLPFTIQDIESNEMTTKEMFAALQNTDLGKYIAFAENAFHYLAYEDHKLAAQDLITRSGQDIDLIITFGTSAGLFVKNLALPVPMVDYSATDPVASGIIDSATEGSGNKNVWAQVEPSLPLRQIKYYYSVQPFRKMGVIIYGDEIISGLPDIKKSSEEIGFELVIYHIDEQPRETKEEQERYYQIVADKFRQMSAENIDAFFLTVDLINEPERILALLEPLYDKNIPVYLMDDVTNIKHGALMLISAYDYENVGRFVADTVTKILSGAEAGSLPCVYRSAPSIYFNYDIAMRINYPLKFEFLAVCDEIFTSGEKVQNER